MLKKVLVLAILVSLPTAALAKSPDKERAEILEMRQTQPRMEEAFISGPTVYNPDGLIPNDEEIPLLLNKVFPCHEVVKIDYFLPGCPPSADTLWEAMACIFSFFRKKFNKE